MEEILDQVSNPFDQKNFRRLLNLYKKSSDWEDFYRRVITYYQDRNMENIEEKDVNVNVIYREPEYRGNWSILRYYSDFFPTEHRIYINSSLTVTSEIVQKFVDSCIEQNLPYELKYILKPNDRDDGIVIGSNTAVYKNHIDILRGIVKDNPEIIEKCGTPPLLTAKLDNWLGLADENVRNRHVSYTQSRLTALDVAVKRFLLNHPEFGELNDGYHGLKITVEHIKNDTLKLLEEGSINEEEYDVMLEKDISDVLGMHFVNKNIHGDELRLILSDNEEFVNEIYKLFQRECELSGIDINTPTMNIGSKTELLHIEHKLNDSQIDVDKKTSVALINDLACKDNLSVVEQIKLLRAIEQRFYDDSVFIIFANSELNFWGKQGIVDYNSTNNNVLFEMSLFANNILDEGCVRDKTLLAEYTYTDRGDINTENALEKLNNNKKEMSSFFNQPMDSKDTIEQAINNLQELLEKYRKGNKFFSYEIESGFLAKIRFLKFQLENYDKLSSEYKNIGGMLLDKDFTDDDAKILSNINKHNDKIFDEGIDEER